MITNMSHNEIPEEELATITGGNRESMPAINPGDYDGNDNYPDIRLNTKWIDELLKNLHP